ncbi:ankyrin repeat-containing domain protein [Pavlovales sp. CCMP2436]|nr:ankyrin repeat-containing domain protein [Pavlovales sp. CCMP2436]
MSDLFLAASLGQSETCQKLVQGGIDVNSQSEMNGWTALHVAAGKGQVEVIKALIALGATVDHPDKVGFTPLMYTVDKKKTGALSALLEAGVNVNAQDRDGLAALHYAAYSGNKEGVQLLLNASADKV